MESMKVLSLFDGMACGMVALIESGIPVESYHAYEIDKFAVQTSSHNFPMIQHHGDVFQADFSQHAGNIDLLCGGSPCTYWSIAQSKDKRETTSSGIGWELFSQYVRALHEAKPKFFIYENNKSMALAIKDAITETFGFEPICINSALVSAQNRQRLYWVGKRMPNGTYKQVKVEQPKDRGTLLKDVLDDAVALRQKARTMTESCGRTTEREEFLKHQNNMVAVPLSEHEMQYMVRDHQEQRLSFCNKPYEDDKSKCVVANISKGVPYNVCAVPINTTDDGKSQTLKSLYCKNSVSNFVCYSSTYGASGVAYELQSVSNADSGVVGVLNMPNGNHDLVKRVYGTNGKSPTINAMTGGNREPKILQQLTVEYTGTQVPVYTVKDGQMLIKDKWYPVPLADGLWIVRKLTTTECMRLQTVPEWYEFPVSKTQTYKMLGNGWTIQVICHLLDAIMRDEIVEDEQLSLF